MRKLIRAIIHLAMLLCLLLGLALLIATPMSFWRGAGTSAQITRWPHTDTQVDSSASVGFEQGRLHIQVFHDISNGKFGTSPLELGLSAGLYDPTPLWTWHSDDSWFNFHSAFHGQRNADNPLSVSAYFYKLTFPAPLLAAALMLTSLLWLAPAVARWRTHRVKSGICLHCGYDLHASPSDTCPECGAQRPLVTVSGR